MEGSLSEAQLLTNKKRKESAEKASAIGASASGGAAVSVSASGARASSATSASGGSSASGTASASAGLYEDRDQSLPQCYCAPSAANSSDPRNDLLLALLEEEAPSVRLHDTYRLFQPFWHMHVARTVAEHPRPNATRDAPACDCTHYCYLPEFWSGVYWPALLRALS